MDEMNTSKTDQDTGLTVKRGTSLSMKLKKKLLNRTNINGAVAILGFFVLWYILVVIQAPFMKHIPTPITVSKTFLVFLQKKLFWISLWFSTKRVFYGFAVAMILGIPLGLAMGWSQKFKDLAFPVFEVLRPIPPLAWVPVSILFWPTNELSIIFITFIGAFFTIVLNVLRGVASIDKELYRSAISLGAKPRHIFWKIILPASIPSIATGMMVGIGITWNVVIAAEMIAGNRGIGRLTWEGYLAGDTPTIIVGMITIGFAGWLSSAIVKIVADKMMPWRKLF
ncbi:bicarbonate transport system permease protein CmpB [bacterium BMS3Bbin06]|nr:bicarbonate transport system permease protein CmpB [bacterium BMS3Abin08]GBE34584.1 bicarbonate transport system permease protein CmpB [bacterium BMS3Bbin06]HDO36342.1 ABC transporter permease [Nitrospirota bacterium]HDY71181.1 ABC transporter permease [Nitrospirota bacterium]